MNKNPQLMSLPQMMNLSFDFKLRPDGAYLSSPHVREGKLFPLLMSTSKHLVVDLAEIMFAQDHQAHVSFGTVEVKEYALPAGANHGDPSCEACRGKHVKHTCAKGQEKSHPDAPLGASSSTGPPSGAAPSSARRRSLVKRLLDTASGSSLSLIHI